MEKNYIVTLAAAVIGTYPFLPIGNDTAAALCIILIFVVAAIEAGSPTE